MAKQGKVTKATFDHTWSNSYGEMHDHNIEFENGDKGVYSSKSKEQTKFIIGKESWYNCTPKAKGTGNKITAEKAPDVPAETQSSSSQPSYSKQTTPEEQKRIQKQVAYECAIASLNMIDATSILKGHDYMLSDKILEWLQEKGKDNVNHSIMASKAIREAINAITILALKPEGKALSEIIIIKANEIFEYFIAV